MQEPTVAGLPDILQPGLKVLFCGINPGVCAAAAGHHFLGRGNRFWRVMHAAGFTPKQLDPLHDRELLRYGCGLTTAVARPSARADQISQQEFSRAARSLREKVERAAPEHLAFLGKAAYAALSARKDIDWGDQRTTWGGASVCVLPNPSGLNRGFSLDQLVFAYRELRLRAFGGQD